MRETIAVTRFNQTTWNENCRWREKQKLTGCIYGTMQLICGKIHDNYRIYVLEMNNDTNTIEGIGIISNKRYPREKIYSMNSYNRIVYKGTHRIDKTEFSEEEQCFIKCLENLVFKGSTHVKRGSGITIIPVQRALTPAENIIENYTKHIIQFLANEYHFDVEKSIKKHIYTQSVICKRLQFARNQQPDKIIVDNIRGLFIRRKHLLH